MVGKASKIVDRSRSPITSWSPRSKRIKHTETKEAREWEMRRRYAHTVNTGHSRKQRMLENHFFLVRDIEVVISRLVTALSMPRQSCAALTRTKLL